MGLRALVLAADPSCADPAPRRVPPLCIQDGPVPNPYYDPIALAVAGDAGHAQPVLGRGSVHGHHGGQRHRLSQAHRAAAGSTVSGF